MKTYFILCLLMLSVVSCTSEKGTEPVDNSRPSCIVDYHLSIYRTDWYASSRPAPIDTAISERAHIAWLNPLTMTPITDIWDIDIGVGESNATDVLSILFKPVDHKYLRDTVNNIIDSLSAPIDPENSWNGIASYIPWAIDMNDVDFLDFRLRGDEGIMHVDIGRISEDIDGDGRLDDEDKDGLRILDPEEDIGLDGLPDNLEFGYDPPHGILDPTGDNFNCNDFDPWHINGTEGNACDPKGGWRPDTEDRDYDGLYIGNHYFSYRINLADTTDYFNGFYIEGSQNDSGWKTIRIPLHEPLALDSTVGSPSWSNTPMTRLWFDSAGTEYIAHPLAVQIAAIQYRSIGWQNATHLPDSLRSTGSAIIGFINRENDSRYVPPPGWTGIEYYSDLVPSYQSLYIGFDDLAAGLDVFVPDSGIVLAADTARADRFLELPYDFSAPSSMRAFVYGDPVFSDGSDSIMVFFRMGSSPDIYYEHRALLHEGWDPENSIDINLSEIEQLKNSLLTDRQSGTDSSLVRTSDAYAIKISEAGDAPDLTNLTFFAIGLVNLDSSEPASGEIWFCGLHPVY